MDCLCRPSRIMSVRITLLDETEFIHEIKDDLPGQALLDVVFARLNLIETSYFGIRYIDEENQTHWLDPASRISRQLKPKSDPYDLYFGVKFYAADPCKLLEEITRYQLFLQVKQDVLQGRLPVAFELAAELGAFVVQSELGDYDQRRHSKGYVSEFRLLPNQSSELETRVAELHQQLKGMSPATAELNFLDKVKWHDMYGVDLHPVLGEDSVEYFLGLTPSGIVVLRNKTTVAHYYWPRIAKVYYKGRYFMLRISDKNNELSTYGFETPRKSACKHLWRCCVEHHAFFRLVRVAPLPNSQSNNSDLFQLGSRLRYSSRSEKHSAKDALSVGRAPPAFTRVPSKRQPRRVIDDFLNGSKSVTDGYGGASTLLGNGNAMQPAPPSTTGMTAYESPYRSTYSIPTSLGIRPYQQQPPLGSSGGCSGSLPTPDSPRSTRSAPWPRTQQRSLFGNNPSSPRSVRSANTTGGSGGGGLHNHHHHHQHQHRHQHQHQQQQQHHSYGSHRDHVAGSAHQHQQRYRSSSVESHSSNDSRSTRRHKHRHRRTSDNESELSRGSGRSGRSHHRKHRRSRHRRDSAGSDHDSTRGRSYSGHRTSSVRSGSAELIDSTSQWREVQRRQAEASLGQSSVQQASVSKSSMVARSLHSNDSHSDTHSHHKSRRHRKNKSPSDSRNRIWSSELAKHLQFDLVDTAGMTEDQLREIPYTVVETNSKRSTLNLKIHKSSSKGSVGGKSTGSGNTITNGSGSNSGQGKNRVDRIRGLYFQNSNVNDSANGRNGSIRSASTISSRECERNNGLVRMMSSISMGDFISPTGSNLSPLENSALRVSHEHTDSGLGADQDYAYSSERSSDSTRYGTNKSSGASSGSHRKSAGQAGTSAYNSLMHQTVSNQQQHHQQQHQQQQQQSQQKPLQPPAPRQNSFYAQRPHTHKPNYSHSQTNPPGNHPSTVLAPIHTAPHSHAATNPTNNSNGSNSFSGNGNEKSAAAAAKASGNRLLNYTTFENNQYKFSLNNVFGKAAGSASGNNGSTNSSSGNGSNSCSNSAAGAAAGGGGGGGSTNKRRDSFVEWPGTPAAPYYYNGPSSAGVSVKKRDAKSDIGVPIRRLSGQAITKTQLLSGQLANASCYAARPLAHATGTAFDSRLQPAKSDLFLSYIHSNTSTVGEYERPYIYNYKMPQMPDFLRPTSGGCPQQPPPQQQQQPEQQKVSAYHISGAQTADPPPLYKPAGADSGGLLYGGAAPATDVLYYQFDNGKPPIVQQPKSLLHKTESHSPPTLGAAASASVSACAAGGGGGGIVGPLVFLQHGQNVAPANATSTQPACTTNTTITNTSTNSSAYTHSPPCSEQSIEEHDEEAEFETAASDSVQDANVDNAVQPLNAALPTGSGINNNNSSEQLSTHTGNGSSTTNLSTSASASTLANNNADSCNANVNANLNASHSDTNQHHHSPPTTPTANRTPSNNTLSRSQTRNQIQTQNQNRFHVQNSPHMNSNSNINANVNAIQNQNQNISSSLEIILSPIIQSSRRAQ